MGHTQGNTSIVLPPGPPAIDIPALGQRPLLGASMALSSPASAMPAAVGVPGGQSLGLRDPQLPEHSAEPGALWRFHEYYLGEFHSTYPAVL